MANVSPAEFIRQVRREMEKVTFPTRRETTVSVVAVLIMVLVASLFLLVVDSVIQYGLGLILGFGG